MYMLVPVAPSPRLPLVPPAQYIHTVIYLTCSASSHSLYRTHHHRHHHFGRTDTLSLPCRSLRIYRCHYRLRLRRPMFVYSHRYCTSHRRCRFIDTYRCSASRSSTGYTATLTIGLLLANRFAAHGAFNCLNEGPDQATLRLDCRVNGRRRRSR